MIQYTQLDFKIPKTTLDVVDYSFNLVDWIAGLPAPDTITAVTFSIAPILAIPLIAPNAADCTVRATTPPFAGTIVSCWVSGGVAGRFYLLACVVTFASGRIVRPSGRIMVVA